MAVEGPQTFYTGLPRFGEYLDEQWGMFRDDFNALGPIVRAAYVDKNSISGEDDLAGLAIGELDFRNRYRVFYDKSVDEYQIQFNQGTEDTPSWTTYVKIRDEDGRFTVSSDGGLESTAGFYNFDYLTIFTHGVSDGYSKDMVNRFAANRLDGFYWSDDSSGAPVLNLGGSYAALDDPTDGDILYFENGAYREARFDPSDFYTSTGGDGRIIISIR